MVLIACATAQAAEVKVLTHADDGYPALITVTGKIVDGDDQIFQTKAAHIYTAIVYLEGPGGMQKSALDIGLAIRKKGFRTAVADYTNCYSGCALAWLGGVVRYAAKHAHIGFHQASTPDTRAPSGYGNAITGVYLSQLGFPSTTISYVLKALPKTVTVLTPSDARQYAIDSLLLPESEADRYRIASGTRRRGPPFLAR
jgi:hypothetical protein